MGGIKKTSISEGLASWIHEDSSVYKCDKAGSYKLCKFKSENLTLNGLTVKTIKASLVMSINYYLFLIQEPSKELMKYLKISSVMELYIFVLFLTAGQIRGWLVIIDRLC